MIPTTLLVTATFAFFLNPIGQKVDNHQQMENEIKVLTTKFVDQNISLSYENSYSISKGYKYSKVTAKPEKKILEVPVEYFCDTPLEMEEWMKSPKKWNNNEN